MTYKAAFNKLPYGGGKAVIIRPASLRSRRNLMESYGDFIESLGGEFITAVDSGSNTEDMDIVAQRTKHVVCTSKSLAGSGDPSPHTARGVFRGIQAATKKVLRRDNLENVEVLIQGVGNVGYHLAKLLFDEGVKLSVSDINSSVITQCQDEFSATVVEPVKVYSHKCDILSPCALGQIINSRTIQQLNTKIIAGAANNQLSGDKYGEILKQKNIVFIPDFVINSGGLLQIAYMNDTYKLKSKIENIYDSVLIILDNAEIENKPCNEIAIDMAKKVLSKSENKNSFSLVDNTQ
jgi:leucine dehydrogenase